MTMTKQEIIEMAIDSGLTISKLDDQISGFDVDLFDFARAIFRRGVNDEREACAKECEDVLALWVDDSNKDQAAPLLRECAAAIRARSKE